MNWKRILATMLAFAMMFTMMPVVRAADTNTPLNALKVPGLGAAYGAKKLINGKLTDFGNVFWTVVNDVDNPGNKIYGYAEAKGAGIQVYSELVLTSNQWEEAVLTFQCAFTPDEAKVGYYTVSSNNILLEGEPAEVNKDEVDTAEYKNYKITLRKGESVVIKLVSPRATKNFCNIYINNISLTSTSSGPQKATLKPAVVGGSYTVDGVTLTEGMEISTENQAEYKLVAQPAEGYQFIGWKNGDAYINWSTEYTYSIVDGQVIQPVFAPVTDAIFGVAGAKFADLAEADAYAAANSKVIVLLNNGTLPAGDYTISEGNTLLIPYDDDHSVHTEATSTAVQNGELWTNKDWETPSAYRTLTMAGGASITVEGTLNVGGRHSAGPFFTAGSPSGKLGMIQMLEDSKITVANGGNLYCWGYIYGAGTVTAKDGATVHENFQFSDFRGGTATLGIAQTFIVFPLSQYYVQNIEVATTYEYGATEFVWGSIYMQNKLYNTSVKFIGNDKNLCMFVPGMNSTVTKTYDPATDRLIIDVDGNGSINPMALELGGTAINTATFVLPINSNMTININSGTTTLNQSLALLPGVQLNIAENAILTLQGAEPFKDQNGNIVHYQGGNNLIVYDRDQWLSAYKPVYGEDGSLAGAQPVDAYFVYTNKGVKRLQPVAYSPTRSYTRTEDNLVDAVVDINGTLITDGFIYTTVDIDLMDYFVNNNVKITGGGAAVVSSNGTGTLVMNNGCGIDAITLQPIQSGTEVELAYLLMASARLQNADGSYLDTMGAAAGATYSYCAECDQWYAVTEEPHQVEITWVVDNASSTQEVCVGTTPVYLGEPPVKENYEFIGWSATAGGEVLENLPVATVETAYYAVFKEVATAGLKGDLDGDGDVDAEDLTLLACHVGGIEELTDDTALANADVNGDGEIDAIDLTIHACYVGGIISEWNDYN